MGKRALWGSWRISRRTANVSLLWGRCWEGEETPAFWPWIQIFRTMMFNADPNPLVGMVPDGPLNAARIVQELEGFPALNVDAVLSPVGSGALSSI